MSEYNIYKNNQLTFNEYLTKVYSILGIGLATSAIVAYLTQLLLETVLSIEAYAVLAIGACVIELILAFVLSAKLRTMKKKTAWILYFVYAILTGISLSSILFIYTASSVWLTFIITAVMFISMALIGHKTRIDLSKYSSLILPALLTIIVATILNIYFFKNDVFSWIITYVGIVMFLGLVAYDMQMLRRHYDNSFENEDMKEKLMIYGAFQLYLDFINLFIRLLRLLGKRKD